TIYVTHDQIEAMTMGDRVAVMRKGVLQQVASPQELFRRPVNLFVAGFIGSPAMNLLEAIVEGDTISLGEHSFTAEPGAWAAQSERRRVALGVRPESVRFAVEGLPARVLHVEDLGAEVMAHLEVEAVPVVTADVGEIAGDA